MVIFCSSYHSYKPSDSRSTQVTNASVSVSVATSGSSGGIIGARETASERRYGSVPRTGGVGAAANVNGSQSVPATPSHVGGKSKSPLSGGVGVVVHAKSGPGGIGGGSVTRAPPLGKNGRPRPPRLSSITAAKALGTEPVSKYPALCTL